MGYLYFKPGRPVVDDYRLEEGPLGVKRIKRIVDNRVLLLGIDQHYREGMKLFEAKVLLGCAKAVAERLRVVEADVPIEGYYDNREIPELKSYFRLMRALQEVKSEKGASARNMAELKRLREILGSAMYGRAQYTRRGVRMLLPAGRDAFSARAATGAATGVPAASTRRPSATESITRCARVMSRRRRR